MTWDGTTLPAPDARTPPGRAGGPPVDNAELIRALGEFAATVSHDFSLEEILRQLAVAVTRVLRVDGAGVAAPSDGGVLVRMVYATDDAGRELESLQERLQAGPCVDSLRTGELVNLADVTVQGSWPRYQTCAREVGVRAVAAIPLLARERSWGVLDVYRADPVPLSETELAAVTMLANLATSYLVVADDRDTARRAQHALTERAMHDTLTGLPVRWVFLEHLEHAVGRLREAGSRVAVLFLDLDGLKYVNDTFGHAAGDRLLVACVRRIRSALRPQDVLSRIGGDEFVVLLEDVDQVTAVVEVARRVQEALRAPYRTGGRTLSPSASIGIAVTGDGETPGAALIAHADAAMYRAKRTGPGRLSVFDPGHYALDRTAAAHEQQLAQELRLALEADQLEVYYQPIVDLDPRLDHPARSGRPGALYAVEALVRWHHPQRGLLTAGEFIDTAERAGLLPELGSRVIGAACRQLVAWDEQLGSGSPGLLFVNISPVELLEPALVPHVAETLAAVGLDARRLTIEVTETGIIAGGDAGRTLDELTSLGCELAIDDFGTGYSSLSRLVDLPASTIKIDRSFMLGLRRDTGGDAIVTAVQVLGERLERRVVAEGVEDQETLARLGVLGVRYVQGFHVAAPMPPCDLPAFLDAAGVAGVVEG